MEALKRWRKKHQVSLKIFGETHDELNRIISSLSSKEIKQRNGLSKSALIRDYFETKPLIDYGTISRVTANLIDCGLHPIEAVHTAAALYYSSDRIPQEIDLSENIHKISKLLELKERERELVRQDYSLSVESPQVE